MAAAHPPPPPLRVHARPAVPDDRPAVEGSAWALLAQCGFEMHDEFHAVASDGASPHVLAQAASVPALLKALPADAASVLVRRRLTCTDAAERCTTVWAPHAVHTRMGFGMWSAELHNEARHSVWEAEPGVMLDRSVVNVLTGDVCNGVEWWNVRHANELGVWWVTWDETFSFLLADARGMDEGAPPSPFDACRPLFDQAPPPPSPRAHSTLTRVQWLETEALACAAAGIDPATRRHAIADDVIASLAEGVAQRGAHPAEGQHMRSVFLAHARLVHNEAEARFLADRLMLTQRQRDGIAGCEQRRPLWFKHRKIRVTGSRVAAMAGMTKRGVGLERAVQDMIGKRSFNGQTDAMRNGTLNEPRAFRAALAVQRAWGGAGVSYQETGLVVDPVNPWLAGSPDMIVMGAADTVHATSSLAPTPIAEAQLVTSLHNDRRDATHAALGEIKCPNAPKFYPGGVRCEGNYYAQIHCNMSALGLRTAVFATYLRDGAVHIEHVPFDDEYWRALRDAARTTFFELVLPVLVLRDSGHLPPDATAVPVRVKTDIEARHGLRDESGAHILPESVAAALR